MKKLLITITSLLIVNFINSQNLNTQKSNSISPQFDLNSQYFICPNIHEVLIGEDNDDSYTYHWYEANDLNTIIGYDETLLVNENDIVMNDGIYVLSVIDVQGNENSKYTTVSIDEQMTIKSIKTSTFNRPNNKITIDVYGGSGDFEFTLIYNDFEGNTKTITQNNNPIFDVIAGVYKIKVVDRTNCSLTVISDNIYILDYPPFFTPNGDLQHDTWQILNANIIPNASIYIFDRYGKAITKLDPKSIIGWDGSYNGKQLPASDYWFSVIFKDPSTGKTKTINGHFSIIRK